MPLVYDATTADVTEPGGKPTAGKFRLIAEWLDLADRAFAVLSDVKDVPIPIGDGVQDDLRRWADELDQEEANIIFEGCARICHEANRALQIVQADPTIPVSEPWDSVDAEMQESAVRGVIGAVRGNSPAESHAGWMAFKKDHGWVWGPIKDEATKEHPLLVPYEDLPESQRVKDRLFLAIVEAIFGED